MRHAVGRSAVTLVEVLVALSVLAVNVAGWAAAVQLLVALARDIAVLTVPTDVDDVVSLCGLAARMPRRVACPRRGRRYPRPQAHSWGRHGLTLVEVLVALGVGAMALGIAGAVAASTARVNRDAQHRVESHIARVALPALLAEVVQAAGRGLDEGTCGVKVGDAGERLIVRSVGFDGSTVIDEIYAARDAAGRHALYLRRVPHNRQPWIEDVTRFRVIGVLEAEEGRATRVEVEIVRHEPEQHYVFGLELPHWPCVVGAP